LDSDWNGFIIVERSGRRSYTYFAAGGVQFGGSATTAFIPAVRPSALRTEEYFRERAARANIKKAKQVLKRAGKGQHPVPWDEK
jgi:hypothetical protein